MNTETIFTLEHIQTLPESKLVLVIDGGVYDLTEFSIAHPGGLEVLKRFNRKDASKAFAAVKHSHEAFKLLPKYRIGLLEGQEQLFHAQQNTLHTAASGYWQNLKQKLVTHEDHFYIHKILGGIALSHFMVRMAILVVGTVLFLSTGSREVFNWNVLYEPAWLLILMALFHGALSLSSLQFSVPRKSSQSLPMIHALFRAHSITFALRAVACMILYVALRDYPEMRMLAISIVVLAALFIADEISEKLTDKSDRFDTTSSMPYWFGVSLERQKLHKYLYGYGQYLATMVCLVTGYAATLYTLAPIQGAAFGMTLVRKNLLSPRVHHTIYLILLYLPIPFVVFFYPKRIVAFLALTWFFYELRRMQVNKYLIWVPFIISLNIYLVPKTWWPAFIALLAVSSGAAVLYNLHLIRKKGVVRVDSNNRLLEKTHINPHCVELKIRTRLRMHIQPGQHILLRLNNEVERKYTPVWTEYLEDSDQTLLTLRVKQYPEKSAQPENSASHFLGNCAVNTILDIHGPIGEKYYSPQHNAVIDDEQRIELNSKHADIILISAGSGITPLFQIAQNLCGLGEKVTLVTCDATPNHMLMQQDIQALQQQCPAQLKWISFFSQETQRLNAHHLNELLSQSSEREKIVLFCGPKDWENMISQTLNSMDKVQLINW